MTNVVYSRTLSRVESLIGVFLALLIPLAAVGGKGFMALTAMMIR